MIFFERNFEALAIQLADDYEECYSISHSDSRSNFFVVGATDREAALVNYQQLLSERKLMTT